MHIRRGDYVSNKEAAQHHGTCNAAYYEYAFKLIKAQIPGARFVFFSDDIEWCKEAFDHLENKLFIDPKSDDIECDDLYKMSRCNHHIIANMSS
ncbi:MAG: alpha-1,2-fucosyltransferase [Flavobacteriales bacterium]